MIFSKSITFDGEEIGNAGMSVKSAPAALEEQSFVERLKAGEAAAFDNLIDRYSGDIFAVLYRITENAEEANDLTQETFMRVLRSIKTFRGDSELKTWLFRIAINESRNRFRWWKRRRRDSTISLDATIGDTDISISDTLADASVSPEDAALQREREFAIKSVLLDIPEIYREAVVLCDIEGFTYDEMATALGVNIGTVKSRISRGREELRRRLKDF